MTKHFDWGALLSAVQQAEVDYRTNAPLPPSRPMTMTEAAELLKKAQAQIPAIDAWIKAHPGAVRAAERVLAALSAQGVEWAGELEAAIGAAPGALTTAADAIPKIAEALAMFAPAQIGIPGGWSGARGRIL